MKRHELIKSLRDIADHLEGRDFDDSPNTNYKQWGDIKIQCDGIESLRKNMLALGTCEKKSDDYDFKLIREFDGLDLIVYAPKNTTCRKVKKIVTEEKEVWECPDSLLAIEAEMNGEVKP